MVKLKIMSNNIRGLSDYNKRRDLFHAFHKAKYDVILLQEVHSTKEIEKIYNTQWGSKIWFSHGSSQARGVAILFNKNLDYSIHNVILDTAGRYIILYCTINSKKILISNVYAPNSDSPLFFEEWLKNVSRFTPEFYLLAGDFNLVLDLNLDKSGGSYATHSKSKDLLTSYMKTLNLIDIWREMHPDSQGYTWKRLRPSPIFERLDFFLISEELAQLVIDSIIGYAWKTDHSRIEIIVQVENFLRGPGYWKFNTSLLRDVDYVAKINSLLDIELAQQYPSKKMQWEMIKMAVRGSTIQYSARKKKSKNNQLVVLEKKLKLLQTNQPNLPPSLLQSTEAQIDLIQKDMNHLLAEKAMGAVIRSRSKWEFHADRPSKYFMNLEKRNACKRTIYRLQLDDGSIITDQKEILKQQMLFYKNLYQAEGEADLSYIEDLEAPKITLSQKEFLDSDISQGEIARSIKQMANNKSPGTDGLPVEFYKMFYGKLKSLLFSLFEEIIEEKSFHLSAKRGIISLLEKVGQSILKLKSWRPLSLLNVDFKVFSKILASRLHTVLNDIIHDSQTGFIKGRYMAENIMKMMNLIEYCNKNAKSAAILSIDFEKAFDKVSWQATIEALKLFGIGDKFVNLIKIMFQCPTSTVLNNGFWSDWFYPTRGNRQGDPISPLLFTLTIEILGIKLRANPNIKGINTARSSFLSAQYADDLYLALEPEQENLNQVILELEKFKKFSGLSVNFNKTVAFVLGPLRDTDPKFYTLKPLFWSDGPVKMLGVYIHPDWNIMHRENFEKTLEKMEATLNIWCNRSLSIPGKIT